MAKAKYVYIIMGVSVGIIGVVSYGVGYVRGGEHTIEETKKEFEKIIDDLCTENDRHLDEMTEMYESFTNELRATIDVQHRQIMDMWNCLSDEDKKKFVVKVVKGTV